ELSIDRILIVSMPFDYTASHRHTKAQPMFHVISIQYRFTAAEMPTEQLYWNFTSEHDSRCFGIAPNVVLRSVSYVAFAAGRAAHDHAAAAFGGDAGIALQRHSGIASKVGRRVVKIGRAHV